MAAPPKNKPTGVAPSVRYATSRSQDRRSPSYSRGQLTAQSVLAEVSTILKSHWDPITPKLETDFVKETKRILPKLGIKNIPDATVSEIAKEAVDTSLDALSTVQSSEQMGQALADSLARSISANIPDPNLHQDKIYEQVLEKTEEIKTENAPQLESSASLGNAILTLTTSPSIPIIAEQVNQKVEEEVSNVAPLASAQEIASTQKSINDYAQNYQEIFANQIHSALDSQQTPSLEQLQTIKGEAHAEAIKLVPPQTDPKNPIDPKTIANEVATSIGLKPLDAKSAEESGLGIAQPSTFTFADAANTQSFGVGIGLSAIPQIQKSSLNALLTNDSNFNQNLLELTKALKDIEQTEKERKLTRQEKSKRKTIELRVKLLTDAKKDELKNPKRIKTLRSFFQDLKSGNRLIWASNQTQAITNTYGAEYADISAYILKEGRPSNSFIYQRFKPGIDNLAFRFAPQAFFANPTLLAGKARGRLGFGLSNLPAGNLSSIFKNAFSKSAIRGGMGMNPAVGFAKKLRNILGGLFGGMGMYFLMLGQAAFTGFLIGAGIGASAGAIFGATLPIVALGPAGVLLWPVTIPLGAFAGGIVGGLAGGLIAFGLASGSTTAVSAGVGAGVGGIIGGWAGFALGQAIGGVLITAAAAACAATLIGCVLVPVAAVADVAITMALTSAFAIGGAIIGGFAGYVVGRFIINPVSNLFGAIGDSLSGISFGTPGFLGTIGGWFTSGASIGWNALLAGANGLWSGLTGGIGSLASGISTVASAAIPSTAVAGALVGGPVAGIGIFGLTTIIFTSAAFFSTQSEVQNHTAGDNQYFTINKTADKTNLPNSSLPQDLTFTITITAKNTKLTNVLVTDVMSYQNKDTTTPVPQDKSGQPISPIASCQNDLEPTKTCTAAITITVTDAFKDSVIINTVKVTATPEGKNPISDSKTATVVVGTPPAQCPRGWPNIGVITQAPEGGSHGTEGFEAIDVATPIGTSVFSTLEGKVVYIDQTRGDLDKIIDVQPLACPGLNVVRFQHLSAVNVNNQDIVHFGQVIGETGTNCHDNIPSGCGPHTHYQFNVQNDRSFKLVPPYIPINIDRTCSSNNGCIPPGRITSAPL